jgi:hypothetical protein
MDEYHPGIVDRFPLCMALLDRELVVRAWNGYMEQLLNRPATAAVGQPLGRLPEFRGLPVRAAARHALERVQAVHLSPRRRGDGGGPFAGGVSLAPLRRPDGAVSGFLLTVSRVPAKSQPLRSPSRARTDESRWRVGPASRNREAARLALLGAVSELVREPWQEPASMLQAILDLLATEVREEALAILGLGSAGTDVTLLASRGLSPQAAAGLPAAAAGGLLGQALRQGLPVFLASTEPAEVFCREAPGPPVRSLVAIPVRSQERIVIAALCCLGGRVRSPFGEAERAFFSALTSLVGQGLERQPLLAVLSKGVFDTVQALAEAIEAKDPYTKGHVQRVTQYALALGEELGLAPGELRTLQFGATLHDIGKIGIRSEVLNKPGPLTDPERAHIRSHPIVGEQIVAEVDFLQQVRPCIRCHQERFDGTGYPDGLRGEGIPLLARIIAVADVFDALTTDRPYRPALPVARALALLREEAGRGFDPNVVETLCRMLE